MAHRGNHPRDPHLQVGSRLIAAFICLALTLTPQISLAASKSPTPQPSSKVSAKPSPKATASNKAPVKKAPAKKAPAKKKKNAKVRVTPSPKPAWPPKGFSVEGEVYAKVPTAKELVSLISASSSLEKQIKECTTYICGAVQVTAENGCNWWQAVATVTDGSGRKLGELTRAFGGSGAKEFRVLLMISPETVENGGSAKVTSVICNHVDRDPAVPASGYVKAID